MKTTIFATLCLALLALGWAHPSHDDVSLLEAVLQKGKPFDQKLANNYIDRIVKNLVGRIRDGLTKYEPYPLTDVPAQNIQDENVQATVQLKNVKENHASEFVVNNLNNHLFSLSEDFDISFPRLDLTGDYTINGKVLGKDVNGNGQFTIEITNLRIWGTEYLHLVHGDVQIKRVKSDYSVDKINASVTGLTVEGLTQKDIDTLLSSSLQKYFTDNERLISRGVNKRAVEEGNKQIKGKSLRQFLNWLKHVELPPPAKAL